MLCRADDCVPASRPLSRATRTSARPKRAAREEDGKVDEVKIAQTVRVVSACEATYRIVQQFPPVQTSKVTLPHERIAFAPS